MLEGKGEHAEQLRGSLGREGPDRDDFSFESKGKLRKKKRV